jgi:transcriptional regulator with XRE-family HTH domain
MNNLKKLRQARGLTQKQLADKCGVDHTTISRAERGQTALSSHNFLALALALEVDPREISELVGPSLTLSEVVSKVPAHLEEDFARILNAMLNIAQNTKDTTD